VGKHSSGITTLLVLTEACYLYPFYQLAAILLGWHLALSPVIFFMVTALFLLVNLRLAEERRITLLLANVAVIGVALFVPGLLKPLTGAEMAAAAVVLAWLSIRSRNLFARTVDVFVHFDVSILVIFLGVVVYSVLQIPGGFTWLMLSFLLNIFTISLYAGAGQGKLAWLGGFVAAIVLVPLFATAQFFLPMLTQPAQVLYSLGRPVAGMFQAIIGYIFSGYVNHLAKQRSGGASNLATDTNNAPVPLGSTEVSPVFEAVMRTILIIFLIFIAVIVLAILLYLARLFWIWLLRRQGKPVSPALSVRRKLSWKTLFGDIPVLWKQLKIWLLPWLPVHLDIAGAYKALLQWGGFRDCPKEAYETPDEYLSRLTTLFPRQEQELHTLTAYYVLYKYGKDNVQYPPEELKTNLRRLFFPGLSARTTRS
jgi:hypothetical protein